MSMAMIEPTAEQAISREEAKHVVHEAIFGLCMKDKNTCAGDYSYHSLQALDALPDLEEQARKEERDAIVAWLRKEVGYNQAVADDGCDFLQNRAAAAAMADVKNAMANCIHRGDHNQ